jgi:hypothetical protein
MEDHLSSDELESSTQSSESALSLRESLIEAKKQNHIVQEKLSKLIGEI